MMRYASQMSWRNTFTALRYPNYRLWFIGQLASLVGTWMQTTAQGFLVYQLTGSPAYLGYVGFASGVPVWLFTLYGGVITDRISRRKLLLITQTAMMLLAFILAALTFTGLVQAWQIIVLSFLLGTANAFDAPARQAFVLELVEREDLANAIALNSTMFNSATAVGPAVAGITYALVGPAWCFTINGISFLAVIAALALMHLKPWVPPQRTKSATADLVEGLRYIRGHFVIRTLILVSAVVGLFGMAYATLFPAWAVTVLGGDATTNGLLQSARGLGSLIAALMIASLGRFTFKGKLMSMGMLLFPIFLLIWTVVRWLPLSLAVMVGVGWAMMIVFNLMNALIQHRVDDALRGRVMSVYSLSFFGFMPVSALMVGTLAEATTEPIAVAATAAVCLAFAIWLWLRVPEIRKLS